MNLFFVLEFLLQPLHWFVPVRVLFPLLPSGHGNLVAQATLWVQNGL